MVDSPPTLPDNFAFHHIGYATASVKKELAFFESLGYRQEGAFFADPLQGVGGCFMTGAGPRIELLENLAGAETLTPWINAGIKMYHFAYCVGSMAAAIDWARAGRGKVIVPPTPAVAFGGSPIAFVMFPNRVLLEFIEQSQGFQ